MMMLVMMRDYKWGRGGQELGESDYVISECS